MPNSPKQVSISPYLRYFDKLDFLIPGSDPVRFYCPGCGQERSSCSWNNHQRKGCAVRQPIIPCPECDKTFSLTKQMTEHYHEEHGHTMIQQRKFFYHFQVEKFKSNLELESGFDFQNRGMSGNTIYFVCKVGYEESLVRNNNNCDTSCAAFMNVTQLKDGKFSVQYCNNHIHDPIKKEPETICDDRIMNATVDCGGLTLGFDKYGGRTQELKSLFIKTDPIFEESNMFDVQSSLSNSFNSSLRAPKEVATVSTHRSHSNPIYVVGRPPSERITGGQNQMQFYPFAPTSTNPDPPQSAQKPSLSRTDVDNYNAFLTNVRNSHRLFHFVDAEKKLIELEYLINENGATSPEAQRALMMLSYFGQTVDLLKHKSAGTGADRVHPLFNGNRPFHEYSGMNQR